MITPMIQGFARDLSVVMNKKCTDVKGQETTLPSGCSGAYLVAYLVKPS